MAASGEVISGVAIKVANVGLGLAVTLVLARVLGPEEYGVYAVVLALVLIVSIPSSMGLPNYVVREVARAQHLGQPDRTRGIVASAVRLALLVSLILVGLMLMWAFLGQRGDSYRATLLVGAVLVPVMALLQIVAGALRGLDQVTRGLVLALTLRMGIFLGLLLTYLVVVGAPTSALAMRLHLAGGGLALGYAAYSWFRFRPAGGEARSVSFGVKEMLASSGVLGLVAGASNLNSNLDVIMLGALTNAETAGTYKLASTGALATVAGLQAVNMVMMPRFARLRDDDREALQELAARSVRYILITTLPVSILLTLLGRPLIGFVFGPEYSDSYLPMVILIVGQLVSAALGSVIALLNMTGHEVATLRGVLLGTAVNVVLSLALIPRMGAVGAAIATATTLVSWNVYLHLQVRKYLSINSSAFTFLNVAHRKTEVVGK